MTARERRRVVQKVEAAYGISERRAIRFTGFARSSMRYRAVRDPQEGLRARILELAGSGRVGASGVSTCCFGARGGR